MVQPPVTASPATRGSTGLHTDHDVPQWRPGLLYESPSDPHIRMDLERAQAMATELSERYRGRVGDLAPADLAAMLERYEQCLCLLQRVDGYVELLAATGEDGGDMLAGRADGAWSAVVERVGFLEAGLARLGAAALKAAAADGRLARHAALLDRLSAQADGTGRLPEEQERILARLAVTGTDGWTRLGRRLLDRILVTLDGERVGLGSAVAALHDPDPELRTRAHTAASQALAPEAELRATALGMTAQDLAIRAQLRGQPSWLSERHALNQVGAAEIDRLVGLASERFDLVHEFVTAKGRLLGGPALRDIDRYAPVGREPRQGMSWSDACDLVTEVFSGLAPALGRQVRALLAGGQVDGRPRPGKNGRPFARMIVPSEPPIVSLTFTGRLHDVPTLAHELGHAVHFQAAAGCGLFGATPHPVLAESVALLCEGLVAERLGAGITDPAERVWFLARQLEGHLVTPLRHAALHGFEDRLHRHAATSGPPTTRELSEWWLDSQRALYGPGMSITPDFGVWWSSLDSFVTAPGSCYSYLYGGLAAHILLARHRADPVGARDRLLDLLAAGSTRPPAELMKMAGADIADPACWERGLASLGDQLAEFQQAATELPDAIRQAGGSSVPTGAAPAKTPRRGGELE